MTMMRSLKSCWLPGTEGVKARINTPLVNTQDPCINRREEKKKKTELIIVHDDDDDHHHLHPHPHPQGLSFCDKTSSGPEAEDLIVFAQFLLFLIILLTQL